jgi:hypothetical protein
LDQYYDVPLWLDQPEYVEVWVEKDALSGLFMEVCGPLKVRLFPCRGYSSITFLYEAAKVLRSVWQPITILYFGDRDMRGVDIERYLTERLEGFSVSALVQRIALTKEQVEAYHLPSQPAKASDTMARQWIEQEGNVAWELDALDPDVLTELVRQAVLEHFDAGLYEERNTFLQSQRDKVKPFIEALQLERASCQYKESLK